MQKTHHQTSPATKQATNELQKTLTFVGVAVFLCLFAWFMTPRAVETDTAKPVQRELFPEFKSALAATSLSIDEFNPLTSEIRPFKVAKVNGNWVIPSHQDYPTDAKDQLAAAAASLVGLQVLGVESDSSQDHAKFGVIAPVESEIREHGTAGVGTRVTVGDANDKILFDAIIGSEVKGQPGQRYVRIGTAKQLGKEPAYSDQVYSVVVNTEKLTANFDKWIEHDLLKMSAFDIRQLELKDYSVDTSLALTGQLAIKVDEHSDITLNFDDQKADWTLVSLQEFDANRQPQDVKLADDEELNTAKLSDMKTALSDLKIVDVERKPGNLGGDLDAFVRDREAFMSLVNNGFYPMRGKDGKPEIRSNDGEVRVRMKDGVEYVLRFGAVASLDTATKPDENKDKTGDQGDANKKTGPSRNRFLFVMADFNENMIPKPVLEPLPDDKKDTETNKTDAAKKPTADAAAKTADQKDQKTDAGADATADANATAEKEMADAQRQAIEKENHRRQDEYDAKIKAGQEHVKKLNDRFSDWYYVVSDDVYQKIHLSKSDVVKKKADPAKDPNVLRELQQGLQLPGQVPQQ